MDDLWGGISRGSWLDIRLWKPGASSGHPGYVNKAVTSPRVADLIPLKSVHVAALCSEVAAAVYSSCVVVSNSV